MGSPRIALITGCFDLLHVGHIRLIRFANELRAEGAFDQLIAGINSDESVASTKPGRPIVEHDDRAMMLSMVKGVDRVYKSDGTHEPLIRELAPTFYIKGYDYRYLHLPEADLVRDLGGQVIFGPEYRFHTGMVIEKIRQFYR